MPQALAVLRKYDRNHLGALQLPEFRDLARELRQFLGRGGDMPRHQDSAAGGVSADAHRPPRPMLSGRAVAPSAAAAAQPIPLTPASTYDLGRGAVPPFQTSHPPLPSVDEVHAAFLRFDTDKSNTIDIGEPPPFHVPIDS